MNCYLAQACAYVEHVLNVLKKWRAGEGKQYKILFRKCQAIADRIRGHIDMPRAARKHISVSSNPERYYGKSVIAPFLYHAFIQVNERFEKHNTATQN